MSKKKVTKPTYQEQLENKKWLEKRQVILKRDLRKCTKCKSEHNLNVHHKYYVEGKMAWEYPDHALVTVCEPCHNLIHQTEKIEVRRNNLKPKKKKLTWVEKLTSKLSKEDRDLQNKYDKLKNR